MLTSMHMHDYLVILDKFIHLEDCEKQEYYTYNTSIIIAELHGYILGKAFIQQNIKRG